MCFPDGMIHEESSTCVNWQLWLWMVSSLFNCCKVHCWTAEVTHKCLFGHFCYISSNINYTMTDHFSWDMLFVNLQDLSFVDFSFACLKNVFFSRANLQCAKFRVGLTLSYMMRNICKRELQLLSLRCTVGLLIFTPFYALYNQCFIPLVQYFRRCNFVTIICYRVSFCYQLPPSEARKFPKNSLNVVEH